MPKNLWNCYQVLKPTIVLLTVSGLFSLDRNTNASKFVKILTNIEFRFSCTLIIFIMFLSTLYVNGTRRFASNVQAIIYGFYCLINVSFLLSLNFHSKGHELLKKIVCNNELRKNLSTRAFVITFFFYILCTALSLAFHTRSFFNEVIRRNDLNAFYPFKDHNSVESFTSIAIVTFIISPGEHL